MENLDESAPSPSLYNVQCVVWETVATGNECKAFDCVVS